MNYEPTIGLEIHAELKTKTKMFCDSLNDPDEKHPNLNVCPICMGFPGTLPVINEEAVKKVILTGLALNCEIARQTNFDRKNYFYPDLPKGYQISQYQRPLCAEGYLEIETRDKGQATKRKIRITRVHLEEDTGRLQHPEPSRKSGSYGAGDAFSLVDFNRAGVPLMEMVTEPDLTSGEEVSTFAEKFRLLLRYLGVSDADMEKGQMRVEVNISVRDKKQATSDKLGTKVEIKNLNSIRSAALAVDYEIERQVSMLEDGHRVAQETRGWDEARQTTFSQRLKETAQDYRYFSEPDLPVLNLSEEYIESIEALMPELPEQRRKRFKEQYGLNDSQVEIFTIVKHLGDYFENVASGLGEEKKLHALAANYIITEFPPLFKMQGMEIDELEGIKISSEAFAELVVMIFHQKISSTAAKAVLKTMAETGLHPEAIAREKSLLQVSDTEELEKVAQEIISENPGPVADYKKGKTETLKFLVGKMMAKTKGQANPQMAGDLLEKLLH
ncbi:MAG: glutaminyl-tRNA synthase (glutamine-hydrolyzing) subunit B [Candidatus Yanofskybacteria bacterium RIFCSPHIGHO2_02_FULL_43_15c]|uniref:Aspartyl/glutamyl-tRNA(Asn/Gln) amidotransferase subunit B n=2 Tax=Candidatus Yanofskyibacteriota TaxID=1752733 RepID=A0A1F8FE73_9BACT|nr:MAG: glutaminyl-tRNA synthase (glutamine-hydrolyzing) subunit B [Candidatus Yanofskybacteria bacterium RIFCSPHIGHO2_02_FULL_43_15c]